MISAVLPCETWYGQASRSVAQWPFLVTKRGRFSTATTSLPSAICMKRHAALRPTSPTGSRPARPHGARRYVTSPQIRES